MADALSVSYVTANKLARSLEELDILRETTGQSRNRIYVLHEYLHLFTE